jgi:hypothetical protein
VKLSLKEALEAYRIVKTSRIPHCLGNRFIVLVTEERRNWKQWVGSARMLVKRHEGGGGAKIYQIASL